MGPIYTLNYTKNWEFTQNVYNINKYKNIIYNKYYNQKLDIESDLNTLLLTALQT
jgi:hypothetical protein